MCLPDKRCRSSLPKIMVESSISSERYLPFFRLPTEMEWEYAARGVVNERDKYRARLPVSASKIGDYAELKKVGSIARKKPIFGYYDLFGNVSELVSGRMTQKIGGSRVGSWLARGGNAGATSKKPYTSMREEILEFEWREEDDLPRKGFFNKIGFRLALGMPLSSVDQFASSEKVSVTPVVDDTVKVTSGDAGSGSVQVQAIEKLLNSYSTGASLSADQVQDLSKSIRSSLELLSSSIDEQDAKTARFVADNAFTKLVRVWTLQYELDWISKRLKTIKSDTEKSKKKRKEWNQQLTLNTKQILHLMQEYEEGLRVLAEIKIVDGNVVEAIDMSGYRQSNNQELIALEAKSLLKSHVDTIKSGKVLSVKKDVDLKYPFAR